MDHGSALEGFGNTLGDDIKALQEERRRITENMARLVADLQTSFARIGAEIGREVEKAGTASAAVLSPLLASITETSKALSESGVRFSSELAGASAKAGEQIRTGSETVRASMNQAVEAMGVAGNGLAAIATRLEGLGATLGTSLDKLAGMSTQFATMHDVVAQLGRAMKSFQDEAARNTEGLRQAFHIISDWKPPPSPATGTISLSRWRRIMRKVAFWRR